MTPARISDGDVVSVGVMIRIVCRKTYMAWDRPCGDKPKGRPSSAELRQHLQHGNRLCRKKVDFQKKQ